MVVLSRIHPYIFPERKLDDKDHLPPPTVLFQCPRISNIWILSITKLLPPPSILPFPTNASMQEMLFFPTGKRREKELLLLAICGLGRKAAANSRIGGRIPLYSAHFPYLAHRYACDCSGNETERKRKESWVTPTHFERREEGSDAYARQPRHKHMCTYGGRPDGQRGKVSKKQLYMCTKCPLNLCGKIPGAQNKSLEFPRMPVFSSRRKEVAEQESF